MGVYFMPRKTLFLISASIVILLFFYVDSFCRNIRAESYTLDVSFTPEEHFMKGQALVKFRKFSGYNSEISFFLHGELSVDSIFAGGRKLSFSEEKLFYSPDYSLIAAKVKTEADSGLLKDGLSVFYSGYFNPSRARSPSDYMRIDSDGVFLRSYGYSIWFPVFPDAEEDTYPVEFQSVRIVTPAKFSTVFTGRLIKEYVEGEKKITLWSAGNTNIFDAQCTAGRYVLSGDSLCSIYSENDTLSKQKAGKILSFMRKLIDGFGRNYSQSALSGGFFVLEMPEYGDIASGNVVGISRNLWKSFDWNSSSAIALAHELVHYFTRVAVKKSDPLFALATEGFPSYFHLPVIDEISGEGGFYDKFLQRVRDNYLLRRKTGTDRRGRALPAEKPVCSITAEEIGIYKDRFVLNDRVILFFDYLHKELGRQKFSRMMHEVFNCKTPGIKSFENILSVYLPGREKQIHSWLWTTEYPVM